MLSVGVSDFACAGLIFFDPGMKVNEINYCDALQSKQLGYWLLCQFQRKLIFQRDTHSLLDSTRVV